MIPFTRLQRFLVLCLGMILVAIVLYAFDPLHIRLRTLAESELRSSHIDPLYVKGFKQIDSQYFIVVLDGVPDHICPCDDPKVIRGKKPQCPVVHHREKQEIIARGRRLGLPEYNFPVLAICP